MFRRFSFRWYCSGVLVGFSLLAVHHAWATLAQEYTLTDLGLDFKQGGFIQVTRMDKQAGTVVGWWDDSGYSHAMELYPNPHDIGPQLTLAEGVRGSQVVGYIGVFPSGGSFDTHATLWTDGVPQDLGDLGSADGSSPLGSVATCINPSGDIWGYGTVLPSRPDRVPLLWVDQTLPVQLPTLGGLTGQVNACNDRGDGAGESATPDGETHCAFWPAAGGVQDCHPENGTTRSTAVDMNNVSQLVGTAVQNGQTFSFLRAWPSIFWLMPLPGDEQSFVRAINDTGDPVGRSCVQNTCRAIAWENGQPTELLPRVTNGAGWTLPEALGIDNNGNIIASGTLNGQGHFVRLSPVVNQAVAYHNWRWSIYNYYVNRWNVWRKAIDFYYRADLRTRR